MPPTNKSFLCANCEIEIIDRPTYHVGLAFCCAGCVAGGPCTCSYEYDACANVRIRECLDLTAVTDGPQRRAEPALARR